MCSFSLATRPLVNALQAQCCLRSMTPSSASRNSSRVMVIAEDDSGITAPSARRAEWKVPCNATGGACHLRAMTHARTRGWRGLGAVAFVLAGCQGQGGAGDGTAGSGGAETGAATDGAGSESDTEPHEPEGGYADPRAMGPTGQRRQTHAELRNTRELVLGGDAREDDD